MPAYKDQKTKKWYCKFYYKDWNGARKQMWRRGFATKKEALEFEADYLNNHITSCDMGLDRLYQLYCKDMSERLKPSTLSTKQNIYETKILPYFGNMPISQIRAADIRQWQSDLMARHSYSATYLKHINNQLTCLINYAQRFYGLNTDPCHQAGPIGKSNAEEMQYWTLEEYKKFRRGLRDKPISYICFEILYWTGMREGELLALTPADILIDEQIICITKNYQRLNGQDVISTPKTRKSKRNVPIPAFLASEIETFLSEHADITANQRMFPYTKSFLFHEMQRVSAKTGVKRIRIHDIRHSHASLLINQGFDALLLADRLGHEKVSTTLNTYSHLFPHKQAQIISTLQRLGNVKKIVANW